MTTTKTPKKDAKPSPKPTPTPKSKPKAYTPEEGAEARMRTMYRRG